MVVAHDFDKYPELTNRQLQTLELVSPHPQIKEDFWAVVVKVTDGDTITLAADFRDFTFPLRLLDINAPEMNDGGDIARDWLINRVEGQQVYIKININRRVGKYGRLLGRVMYNGMDVGQEEIYLGLAKEFGNLKEGEPEPTDKMFALRQWL